MSDTHYIDPMTAPGPAAPSPHPSVPGPPDGAAPPAVPGPPDNAAPGPRDGAAPPTVPGPPPGPGVPNPPAGPGVAPPFAAPPVEGRRTRLWLGLGAGALALTLCCGGGGAAVLGLLVVGAEAIDEQGRTVSTNYYQALVEREYGAAYDQLCARVRQQESRRGFERRAASGPQVNSFQVGELNQARLTVPVEVTFSGGDRERQLVNLEQNQQTGALEVCGVS